jgi:hypothetical protein
MKSTAEILQALHLTKTTENVKIAKNYQNVLSLINEIKNDIINVEVLNFEEIKPIATNCRYARDVYSMEYYNRFNKEFLKTVKFETSFGSYNVAVPTNTYFYSYLCVILKIQSNYIKTVENLKVENTIYIDSKISDSIVKALKFVDAKNYMDIAKNIYLNFANDCVEVFSTNTKLLYKSAKFDFIADNKINDLFLAVPIDSAADFKTAKNEFIKIDLIDSDSILINGKKCELSKIDSQKLLSFDFTIDQKMQFSKVDFQKNVRSLKGFLDYKKLLKFHLNGSIQMQPVNDSNKSNTTLQMDYLSKDFNDMDYVFGFDNIFKIVSSFKSKDLVLSPKICNNSEMAIFTDSVDSLLIINQLKK